MADMRALVQSKVNTVDKVYKGVTFTQVGAGNTRRHALDAYIRNEDPINTVLVDENGIGIVKSSIVPIISNASFTANVNGAETDFKKYNNFIVTYKTGTKTGSPTLDIKLQYKGADGIWYDDPDYVATQITAAGSGIAFKGFMEAHDTIRVVCTYGGSGDFAATYVTLRLKS